jgi:hypothetical protein
MAKFRAKLLRSLYYSVQNLPQTVCPRVLAPHVLAARIDKLRTAISELHRRPLSATAGGEAASWGRFAAVGSFEVGFGPVQCLVD